MPRTDCSNSFCNFIFMQVGPFKMMILFKKERHANWGAGPSWITAPERLSVDSTKDWEFL